MFIFSCVPQVMGQSTEAQHTVIWIPWFADRRTKPLKQRLERQGEERSEKRDLGQAVASSPGCLTVWTCSLGQVISHFQASLSTLT